MIGLFIAIILFNSIAFILTKRRITRNQIFHIITFTIALQTSFDMYIEFKYHGYWYFSKGIDFLGLVAHLFIVPSVNVMFINWYPFQKTLRKKLFYFLIWEIITLTYELITLLPEPWGYFHYGWWSLGHSVIANPILFFILLMYFKWIVKLEQEALVEKERGVL
ncbi:hypothetical protein ACQKCU_02305 [Heyndrickxia sporothermodurans]